MAKTLKSIVQIIMVHYEIHGLVLNSENLLIIRWPLFSLFFFHFKIILIELTWNFLQKWSHEKSLNRFYLFFFFFYCTVLYRFCHTSTWICHRYTRVPHPETPSLLPPCTIPLGHPSAPAPSIQYDALNLNWWLVSYMILYMFASF